MALAKVFSLTLIDVNEQIVANDVEVLANARGNRDQGVDTKECILTQVLCRNFGTANVTFGIRVGAGARNPITGVRDFINPGGGAYNQIVAPGAFYRFEIDDYVPYMIVVAQAAIGGAHPVQVYIDGFTMPGASE